MTQPTANLFLAIAVIFALRGAAVAQPAPPPPDDAPAAAVPPSAPSHGHAARIPDKSGPAKFPSAIAANYAKDPAGKARRETCLEQYRANKSTGENGGLKWIQKGGGYFSVCSRKLKS